MRETWKGVRSAYANRAKAGHNPSEPEMQELQVKIRALRLEEHVARVVAETPSMTDEQRGRIASLLHAGGGAA